MKLVAVVQNKLLPVPQARVGERLDAGLAKMLGISRTQVAELIDSGKVLVDGAVVDKATKLDESQLIEVDLESTAQVLEVTAEDVPELSIVYQDQDIVVVDKPAGVVSHPSLGFEGPSVPGVLLARGIQLSTSGAQERQGIVQRLDVGTSGLMVLAKSERAYSVLKQAFRDRVVSKTYHALVQGHPDPASGTIDTPIARSTKHDYKFTISQAGKRAITHYETLELLPTAALMQVGLETGRTHQIRVHFSHFRHPLVGDLLYGADPKIAQKLQLERQWLHAVALGFQHPISGESLNFSSEYPIDLAKSLDALRDPEFRL
jgi:23S rRNA pseudouridine1911/1915/1917 synthase